jgi:HEAT repeat protein
MTALDAPDLRVRAAAIEVYLAAQNVAKTPESANRLLEQAETGDKTAQVWSLYTLGLLGNRGVETGQITERLISKLQDPDADIRHWAVEGLAYIGTDATIMPLLRSFHDDPSAFVRERAGCNLAESGMLTREQRRSVIPNLLDDAEDLSLGADTRSWAFQALRDITGQNLPNEPIAWRNWYSSGGSH